MVSIPQLNGKKNKSEPHYSAAVALCEVKTHLPDLHLKELAQVDEKTGHKDDENLIFDSWISRLKLDLPLKDF